jgi:tripartite-type tricarboxylate transporter receptor subunit TctC
LLREFPVTRWLAALIAFVCLAPAALAQDAFPTKAVRIVVPTSPGGVTDATARALAQRLTDMWGQQVIVENRAGANHIPAMEMVAKAAPDGHTLMVVAEAPFVMFPHLYSRLTYDPMKDFTPITALVGIHQALIANPLLGVRTVPELIALGKQKPGQLNYAAFGVASSGHLNMEQFQSMAGVKFVVVQYKGATPGLTDVIGGHVPMMFISVGSALPPHRAGQVRMIAIGSSKRLPELPDVPTVAESGLPGFESRSWFALYGPAAMPRPLVGKINDAVRKIFDDPAFREKFLTPYLFESLVGPPEQFSQFLKDETARWGKVIRDARMKLD